MKTILPKNHKYKNYVGKNGVEVNDLSCLKYNCFQPYNFNIFRLGKIVNRWICRTKEYRGCPSKPIECKVKK